MNDAASDYASVAPVPSNFEQARDFLAALAPGETRFTFQTFDDDETKKRPELTRKRHGSLTERFPELSHLSARGAGVFMTVNRTDLNGRRKENIVAVRALVADLDGAPLSVLERFGLPPHIIVGSSPWRFHLYWRVRGVETAEFTGLQKRLAALLGSDSNVCDLPRLLRLPGFPHQKNPANPHLVWFQAREHSGPYEAEAFRAALAAGERNGVPDKGPAGEGHPAPRQGRANDGPRPFNDFAPARTPAPWSEIGERRLRSALKEVPALDRDTWLKIGFALHDLAEVDSRWPGRALWDEWSRTCPEKFDPAGQDKAWASFGRDYDGPRVTVATIYHLAKENGWRDDAPQSIGAADTPSPKTSSPPRDGGVEATFAQLASLSRVDYDRAREAEAERLGIRRSTLDEEVEKYRVQDDERPCSGRALSLPMPEPWPTPVDGAELLDLLGTAIGVYVKLTEAAAIAVALWCIHAHAFEAATISPRLAITSPEKRCGKTTLLRVIHGLVPRPLPAANITAAALFRTVEAARPTLLIDEADTFIRESEELRGVINSGHARDGQVVRLVGDDFEPRTFSTFCPTAIAAIGTIPGTIEDRSIGVSLRRRKKDERVSRLRADRTDPFRVLNQMEARWVADNISFLRTCDPNVPEELHDRAADNWRLLLSIADQAGGPWPEKARRAALELSAVKAGEADTMRTLLLSDIRVVFREKKVDRLKSEALAIALAAMTDRPWPTFDKGRWITPAGIARMLRPYGIAPETIRFGEETAKGYHLSAFEDAFSRYLPSEAVTA